MSCEQRGKPFIDSTSKLNLWKLPEWEHTDILLKCENDSKQTMWVTFVCWVILGKITPFQKLPPLLFPPFSHIPPAKSHISLFRLSSSYILPANSRLALLLFNWVFFMHYLTSPLFVYLEFSFNKLFMMPFWRITAALNVCLFYRYNYICGLVPVYFFIPETWPQDIPPFLRASSKHYLWTPGWQGRLLN